jgi:hypothetical protein
MTEAGVNLVVMAASSSLGPCLAVLIGAWLQTRAVRHAQEAAVNAQNAAIKAQNATMEAAQEMVRLARLVTLTRRIARENPEDEAAQIAAFDAEVDAKR